MGFSTEFFEQLRRGRLGEPLRVLEVTASTNSDALEWADGGAPEGATVVAAHQTAGRGRWGRSWISEPGRALLFSVVLRPSFGADRAGLLTTAVGLACAGAIEDVAGVATGIKWPNDVTSGGRKVAGVLLESRLAGTRLDTVVAGAGINVGWSRDEFPAEIAGTATSLGAEAAVAGLGPPPRSEILLAAILARLEPLYESLHGVEGARRIVAGATARSELLGRDVVVRRADGRSVEGVARRLTESGGLEVDTDAGPVAVESGEVEHVRAS